MFYILKHLLLILVIFKLKCNNLIFNEIMVLHVSYVCLHAFSLRQESANPDPERWTPHFYGGSVTRGFPLSPTIYLISALSVRPIWQTGLMFLILLLWIGVWKAPPQFPSSFKAGPYRSQGVPRSLKVFLTNPLPIYFLGQSF
jgi:hypothetical protein